MHSVTDRMVMKRTAAARARGFVLVAGLGIALAAAIYLGTRNRNRDLRADSQRFPLHVAHLAEYGWLKDGRLIALNFEGGKPQLTICGADGSSQVLQKEEPVASWIREIPRTGVNFDQALSPNRDWLALVYGNQIRCFEILGRRRYAVRDSNKYTALPTWVQSDATWLQMKHGTNMLRVSEVQVRDIETGRVKATLPGGNLPWANGCAASPGNVYLLGTATVTPPVLKVDQYTVVGEPRRLRSFRLPLPSLMESSGWYSFNSDRKLFALLNSCHPDRSQFTRLLQDLRLRPKQDGSVYGLMVCSVDGKVMREVGRIVVDIGTNGPTNLLWLPDGKRLSFQLNDAVYIVDVENP